MEGNSEEGSDIVFSRLSSRACDAMTHMAFVVPSWKPMCRPKELLTKYILRYMILRLY